MKSMIFVLLTLFSANTWAVTYSIVGGLHYSQPKKDSYLPIDLSGQPGFQGGARGQIDMGGDVFVSTGLELAYKNFKSDSVINYHFLTAEIPFYVHFAFNSAFNLFAGPRLAFNMSTKCDGQPGCEVENIYVKKTTLPAVVGAQFGMTPNWKVEVYYEYGVLPVYDFSAAYPGTTHRFFVDTIGANLIYTLD